VFEMEIPGLNIQTPLDICMCLEFYAIFYFIKRQPGYLKMYLAHLNIF